MRRCRALLLVGLGACHAQPGPDLDELHRRALRDLEGGDPRQAQQQAEDGERRAKAAGKPGLAWSFTVTRALALSRRRDMKGALELLEPAPPEEASSRDRARALMAEGYARCFLATMGGADASSLGPAEALLEKARAASATLAQPELEAEVAIRQAICRILKGDHASAEATYREALAFVRARRLRRHEARLAADMGLLRLRERRFDDAADWLDTSLRISEEVDQRSVSASVIGNLGWAHSELGDVERALPALVRSKELAESAGLTQEAETAAAHLGDAYLQLGDFERARQHYEQGLALARKLGFTSDERSLLQLLQLVALRTGDYAQAEAHAAQERVLAARDANDPAAEPSLTQARVHVERGEPERARAIYERVLTTRSVDVDARWKACFGLARIEERAGRRDLAMRRYREASEAIEAMRRELREETFAFLVFSSLRAFYEAYVSFLVDQGLVEDALRVAERGRGRVMWERIREPDSQRGAAAGFMGTAAAYRATLLAYWLGEERSYLWVVTPRTVTVHRLPARAALRTKVERYQASLQRSRDPLESGAAEASSLYDTLVGPAEASIARGSRVVVLPDGPLHQLSFDALVVPRPDPHYWVEDAIVVRTPSLRVLAARRGPVAAGRRPLLLMGAPEAASEEFPALPNVEQEVRQVKRHFARAGQVTTLTGSAAHPRAYQDSGPSRFGMIHFATHATANPDRPLDSAVVLSRRGLDYKLYARDIVEVPTSAELVTLSACRGAGARVYSGEGLVGFAWAFLSAGAQHVVAGLWDVEDASTARLMDRMYGELARGAAPPEALRAAKLELLRSQTAYRKPYYWGAFVVYTQRQGSRAAR